MFILSSIDLPWSWQILNFSVGSPGRVAYSKEEVTSGCQYSILHRSLLLEYLIVSYGIDPLQIEGGVSMSEVLVRIQIGSQFQLLFGA